MGGHVPPCPLARILQARHKRGAVGAVANPISIRGSRLCPLQYYEPPPGFSDLATALQINDGIIYETTFLFLFEISPKIVFFDSLPEKLCLQVLIIKQTLKSAFFY